MKSDFIQVVDGKRGFYYDATDEKDMKEYLKDSNIIHPYIFDGNRISYDELQNIPDDNFALLYQKDDGSDTYYQLASINVNKEQIENILSQQLTKDWHTGEDLTKKCAYIFRMNDARHIEKGIEAV